MRRAPGAGVAETGALSQAAMDRTIAALSVCAQKMRRHGVTRQRHVATEACRRARNGHEFLRRVEAETGLHLDVIPPEEEARLALGRLNRNEVVIFPAPPAGR